MNPLLGTATYNEQTPLLIHVNHVKERLTQKFFELFLRKYSVFMGGEVKT